ncbi:acetate/propionate family kinase [Sporichthya polymorpha]|uniref:acetate/propionate family kinase n=1 Tax=Sporichthya polymorpha TaxID=35751 RepID=UPI00037AAEAA|nr:acetate/propionate family kinase [Sporichthya polymorpha]
MTARVLVVNPGSSSLKLRVLAGAEVVATADLNAIGDLDIDVLRGLVATGEIDAVGVRVVHGGERYVQPTVVDAQVEAGLAELTSLAPLHQPQSLAAIAIVRQLLPATPMVACFDTAFHATMPAAASVYPIPLEWREKWGLRRYGFHGLSFTYAAEQAPRVAGRSPAECRSVICHLGAGASLCAVRDGRSVDTTMGFTPLDGLVMATRCGALDPGLLLWLQENGHLTEREIAGALEHRSGLLALAGTADLREIFAGEAAGDERCRVAVEIYVHRLVGGIAAMAAALGGLDVLAFTAGVGENSADLRARVAERLAFLGVALDADRNADVRGDVDISAGDAAVRTVVVRAREDLVIADGVRAALGLA